MAMSNYLQRETDSFIFRRRVPTPLQARISIAAHSKKPLFRDRGGGCLGLLAPNRASTCWRWLLHQSDE